jgi:hypothetical protein
VTAIRTLTLVGLGLAQRRNDATSCAVATPQRGVVGSVDGDARLGDLATLEGEAR